ncbi:ATP-binding cassette domain-containing protein [Paenibacillus sp. YN15]|uniref:ATP-binding cassette domain-containing protein n=1 Tax=Paenibacillus sp. YN15 TaxID=1742774 RepID=UPI000DCE9BBD|nr:ATP-binding cassette domain-containing protein [Paenibacillus sp. YN15]RAU93466.1 ABC transporter ATP-binding protein [Paenibacillus sp. YN15]
MTYAELIHTRTIAELERQYPVVRDFFLNLNLELLPVHLPLPEALAYANAERLAEFGCTPGEVLAQLEEFMDSVLANPSFLQEIGSLTILGGRDKSGEPEDAQLTIRKGEIISIVGPTGSGKSRLLGDIECIAQGDTPTGRRILINGDAVDDDFRFSMEGKLVAQLSQNMNFVVDLSVAEFLEMHAQSRLCEDTESVIRRCFACANELAGEKFTMNTKVTQLSGGQSRALMIADTAYMSASPIVLIDEIENAGIDRREAVRLLAGQDKMVLMSTHDPVLALSAGKRIVIRNGGIAGILEASAEERESLAVIQALDSRMLEVRHRLRRGERIGPDAVRGGE